MSNSMRDLISGEAELDDEEDDESFDEDDGGDRRRRPAVEDSSEEEEDDDDEEEARKVREGFIVDEDEDEDDVDEDDADVRPVVKRKREHRDREEEEQLDEDDLELIGEQFGERPKPQSQSQYKRLKRGHRGEDRASERRGLEEIFSDDEDDAGEQRNYGRSYRGQVDEFEDFIEEDFPDDPDVKAREMEDAEVARPRDRGVGHVIDTTNLDKDALDDMEAIFGNGEDYDWALQMEEEEEDREREEQAIELKDVFEPSQLKEKLLTDEDNEIRFTDEPERFQLDRKNFKNLQLTAEQFREEARWITNQLWPKKGLAPDLQSPFGKAVGKVLEFFIVDEVEVPYVFQHRKDYLLHTRKTRNPNRDDPDAPEYVISAEKLLNQDDLWKILELDIKFRSFVDKRNSLEKTFENLRGLDINDSIVEEMIPEATTMEELQDLQDYLHFQYGPQLKDLAAMAGNLSLTKRPGSKSNLLERVRQGKAYNFVRAYGITADQLAKNALRQGKKVSPDDDAQYPMDLADSLIDDNFSTGDQVMNAARQMYAEELFASPRMRKHFRNSYYQAAEISCRRTDKGLRRIDETHPYYEVKYLQNQAIADLVHQPELFLKMMKAEEEGLVSIKLDMPTRYDFRRQLYQEFESENFSDRAEQWREERKKVLDLAYPKLEKIIAKNVKEVIRTFCQDEVLKMCREEYAKRLDQAPYKPKGMILGTTPRVLVLSNGMSDPARDPVCWAWVEEDGRVIEQGKFGNLARDERQREDFVEVVNRRRPDVIGVSGWSADTNKLVRDLETLVTEKGLMGPEFEDPDTNDYRTEPLEVVVVNDEVARLYKDSPRALAEHPSLNPVTRYCVALARYMQNPMKEYAALGRDVTSLSYHPCQNLLPPEKLAKYLDSAMVDMVNLCGVDINEAMTDSYTANLLPYVSGLGPRKASSVIKAINANGGAVNTRDELVGDPDSGKLPVVGPRVWNNCASFLFIEYEATNPSSDPLDNTRVHPEDYELGRKMAADALELDEEDVKAETDENGPGAIVRKLFKQDEQDKVNELVLEEYAEQLERNYSQRKRATLETIRAELQAPYEELRRNFGLLTASEIFTMFTGETKLTLCDGMIVPVNVRIVKDDFAIVKLDCGIEGRVEAHEASHRASIKEVLSVGQTAQAKILDINYKDFMAKLSMREDSLRIPYKRPINFGRDGWDYALEAADKEELREKDKTTGRTQRVVKHPNFKPFNGIQAEEYLGSQPNGEVIIRPSSKGNDHLAVTWKVADGVYQHIDVLEMQKETEFSVGKLLRVGGKYTYSDLDELIVEHVKAMVRKVEEMMRHDKFQSRSRGETENWLTTYINANPNQSTYAFCIDTKHPGYFWLCFKASRTAKVIGLPVRTIPQGFELKGYQYPDMRALCNGFKLRYQNEFSKMGRR
ncbi:Transcription elongation factor Spt6 [Fusarium falciforme]|uniref:Transcription elongation factor Spt6 n=1 Tax=Fusarium falciforme TaxID=195108 RepID=A0A9W8R2V7_9HYPO|nr:Transcription elongation factor Spt6 [Fusarium falciforme]KAJ4185384.1 Transcription elongation factor spt6 [Fusarium falciforme]KAJ4204868.1 Transcription elongation factor spt6 [Fusarium falciforme]KAJ4261333.1 Transcription elongation factor spt6 [Fusarium falciforme]WAO89490.1 Transcription elongation factor Spt6 [Fusarium falciforme]